MMTTSGKMSDVRPSIMRMAGLLVAGLAFWIGLGILLAQSPPRPTIFEPHGSGFAWSLTFLAQLAKTLATMGAGYLIVVLGQIETVPFSLFKRPGPWSSLVSLFLIVFVLPVSSVQLGEALAELADGSGEAALDILFYGPWCLLVSALAIALARHQKGESTPST